MKLGAWIDAGLRPTQVVEVARRLEAQWRDDAGSVESIWISEAYIGWDPVTLAALALQSTTRLRVGTAIVNPYTRHPAVLAMTALTMGQVGPGRFVLGIGTGEGQWMRALGYPFTKTLTLMREAGRQIRQVMRGEAVESGGDRVQLIIRNVDADVPLHLAAIGPRMCELAGREFDGCVLPIATPALVRQAIVDVRAGTAAREGGAGACETVATLLFAAGGDGEANRARLRRKLGLMLMGSGAASLLERNGVDPEHAARFHESIAADGLRRALDQLPDVLVEAFCLYGDLDRCRERLAAYREAGLDLVALLCESDQVENLVALARRT
jgi:5,10-methylenetetrahydromethanopterin reductase